MMRYTNQNQNYQNGFLLIEALVALVIVAIGTLGLIGLQATLQQRNLDAQLRIQASLYANEILNMAITDPDNLGCYVLPLEDQTNCSSNTSYDFTAAWLDEVEANFPGATANTPVVTLLNNDTINVTLFWQRLGDPILHNYNVLGQLIQ